MSDEIKNNAKAVEVKNLVVKFGDFTAVKSISFSVKRGELFGFLGANGAGKTTTIRVLCGLLLPAEGEVTVAGIPLIPEKQDLVKAKVGYMSQKFTLYQDLTIAENLEFIGNLRKIPPQEFQERKAELFNFISFQSSLNTLVQDLPGGTKQQIALTAALLHDPEIVFLDEPTSGVSPAARAQFWRLIRRLTAAGKTIFVTSHYLDEIEQCGRIALMHAGEIIALGSPAELKQAASASFPGQAQPSLEDVFLKLVEAKTA